MPVKTSLRVLGEDSPQFIVLSGRVNASGNDGVALGVDANASEGNVALGASAIATALGSGAQVSFDNAAQIGNTLIRSVTLGVGYDVGLAGITSAADLPASGVTVLNASAVNALVFPNNMYVIDRTTGAIANVQTALDNLFAAIAP